MISDVSVKPEFLLVLFGFVETVNKFILYIINLTKLLHHTCIISLSPVDKANVHVYTFLHMLRKVAILILAEIFIVMEIKHVLCIRAGNLYFSKMNCLIEYIQ